MAQPELQIPGAAERKRRKGRRGAGRGGAAAAAGPRSGCGHYAPKTMSGGSSCSQTPSRAIPAAHRVVLSDGVQLPPGDYSTTPGGTLFSTTPGGRRRRAGSGRGCGREEDGPRGAWDRPPPLGRASRPGGAGTGNTGEGFQGGSEVTAGSERVAASGCLLSGCFLQSRDCKLPCPMGSLPWEMAERPRPDRWARFQDCHSPRRLHPVGIS